MCPGAASGEETELGSPHAEKGWPPAESQEPCDWERKDDVSAHGCANCGYIHAADSVNSAPTEQPNKQWVLSKAEMGPALGAVGCGGWGGPEAELLP